MDFDCFRGKASLLTLPIETRFMIYDSIISCTGSLVIFAKYELTRNIDKQTVHLLHVNRLIRAEVHEYFYKNQKFQFRSFPAMEKFLDQIGPYYAGIIKNVVIGSWLAQRVHFGQQIAPLLKKLTGIERLTIQAPAHGFVTEWSEQAELGDKAIAVLNSSERLAAGKLYLAWLYTCRNGAVYFNAPNVPHPSIDQSLLQSIFEGCDWYKPNLWVSSGLVHYVGVGVEVSGHLSEPTDDQNPKSQENLAAASLSGAHDFIYLLDDEDDPDL